MFSYSFLSPVCTNPTVWVDYDIGVSGSIVILALLPHISKCYAAKCPDGKLGANLHASIAGTVVWTEGAIAIQERRS